MGTGRCGSFEEYSRKCSSAPEAQEEISRWFLPKVSTQLCKPFVCNNEFLDLNAVSPLKTTSVKRCVDALGFLHRLISSCASGAEEHFLEYSSNEPHLPVPINDLADDVKLLADAIELVFEELHGFGADDDDHAYAQVKGAQHVFARHGADFPQQVEDRQGGPAPFIERHVDVGGQDARDVFDQSAASDVRQALDHAVVFDQPFERGQIAFMGLQQLFGDGAAEFGHILVEFISGGAEEQLARQAVPVGVQTRRRQPDHYVALRDARAVDDPVAVDHADDEAREVVFAVGVKSGHLGRLAPEQRAIALTAAGRQPVDNLGDDVGVELARGDVIEEEERPGALNQNVVDAVRHKVVTDRVVDARGERHFQLGADPVAARDQNRLARVGENAVEHPSEAAYFGKDVLVERRARQLLDLLGRHVRRVDVDSRVFVSDRITHNLNSVC